MEEREEEIANAPSRTGILDVSPRDTASSGAPATCPGPEDVYVSLVQIRRFALRKGDQDRRPDPACRATTRSTPRCCGSRR
jgi:transcription termination factor Rho